MKIDNPLLKKFYQGECTEHESISVYEWLSDSAHDDAVTAMLSDEWDETEPEEVVVPVDVDLMLAKIKIRAGYQASGFCDEPLSMDHDTRYEVSSEGGKRSGAQAFVFYRFAAGVASVLLISTLAYKLFFEEKYLVYSTAYGEIKEFTLPDGSHVALNGNSTMKYAWNQSEHSEGNAAPREVFLQGEGFFNIERKPDAGTSGVRFIVHTNHMDIEVLGTSFNVNTRPKNTTIVLASGQVTLDIGNSVKEMMHPGELVEVHSDEREVVKRTVDVNAYSSWKKNKLIFNGTPLKDVLDIIEMQFGYEVVLHDKSLENRLYTDATAARNLDLLLDKLSLVYSLRVTRTDKQIIIETK